VNDRARATAPDDRKGKPVVTAIVVTWNRPDLLRECLRSMLAAGEEAGIALELIVVDNGSTAGDAEVVEREFLEAKLLRAEQNLGFARAVNRALEIALGSEVLLVNNDVQVTGAPLREALTLLNREADIGIVGVKLVGPGGEPQISYGTFDTPASLTAEALGVPAIMGRKLGATPADAHREGRDWIDVDYVSGAFFLIRRAVIKQIGVLDERFYFYTEEADWCLRARGAGWRTVHLPGVSVVHHHGATTSGQAARSRLWLLESRTCFVCKHYGKLWSLPIRLAALLGASPLAVKGLAMVALGRIRGRAAMTSAGWDRVERAWRGARWAISRRWECPEFWR